MKNGQTSQSIKKSATEIFNHIQDIQQNYENILQNTDIMMNQLKINHNIEETFSDLYTSNQPLQLLQQLEQKVIPKQKQKQSEEKLIFEKTIKKLSKKIIKAKFLQNQFFCSLIDLESKIKTITNAKDCTILAQQCTLLLKNRQKNRLLQIKKQNQLQKNLDNLTQQCKNDNNLNKFFTFQTLGQICHYHKQVQQSNSCTSNEFNSMFKSNNQLQVPFWNYLYYYPFYQYPAFYYVYYN